MSLSHDKDKDYIKKLTRANWTTWIEYVRDFIYALEHDDAPDIWNAFAWVQPEGGQVKRPTRRTRITSRPPTLTLRSYARRTTKLTSLSDSV